MTGVPNFTLDWTLDSQHQSDALHDRVQQFAENEVVQATARTVGDQARVDRFDSLAIDIARFQSAHIPGFARLVESTTGKLDRLFDIPAVPVDAFRMTRVAAHPSAFDTATFLTSGTTSGARGGHHFRRTDTYRKVAVLWGRVALLHPSAARCKVISIAPRPSESGSSSLGFMMQAFASQFDSPAAAAAPGAWLLADEAVNLSGFDEAVLQATEESRPLLILATSFALVYLLDALSGRTVATPPGTVVMQTGGFKGKTRQIEGNELRAQVASALGMPICQVLSEYGMTELSSQLYEGTLLGGTLQSEAEWLLPPPWLRVEALDPVTQQAVEDGCEGLACFTDLANVDSAVRILTMDRIIVEQGKVRLIGRYPGALPRGCSLAIEELMR